MRGVAELAGVSHGTVWNAFNTAHAVASDTRDRVLAAAKKLEYHPPRSDVRRIRVTEAQLVELASLVAGELIEMFPQLGESRDPAITLAAWHENHDDIIAALCPKNVTSATVADIEHLAGLLQLLVNETRRPEH